MTSEPDNTSDGTNSHDCEDSKKASNISDNSPLTTALASHFVSYPPEVPKMLVEYQETITRSYLVDDEGGCA